MRATASQPEVARDIGEIRYRQAEFAQLHPHCSLVLREHQRGRRWPHGDALGLECTQVLEGHTLVIERERHRTGGGAS